MKVYSNSLTIRYWRLIIFNKNAFNPCLEGKSCVENWAIKIKFGYGETFTNNIFVQQHQQQQKKTLRKTAVTAHLLLISKVAY